MPNPLVSVIIPVYNVSRYLLECMESVTNQTYQNLEIIAVNDGSTDDSLAILNQIHDSRLQVLSKPNGGLSSARNFGLDRASGDFIFFVDSDDVLHSRIVELLMEAHLSSHSDIVIAGFQGFSEGDRLDLDSVGTASPVTYSQDEAISRLYLSNTMSTMTTAWAKLYRRELFQDIRYPEGKIHEDVAVILDLILLSNSVTEIALPLLFYRCNPVSIMNTPGWNHLDGLVFYEHHYKLLSDIHHPLRFEALLAALKNAVNNAADFSTDPKKWGTKRFRALLNHIQVLARRLPLEKVNRLQDKALVVACRICPDGAVSIYRSIRNRIQ